MCGRTLGAAGECWAGLCVMPGLLDFLWHLLTDICPGRSLRPLSPWLLARSTNQQALIILCTLSHVVNKDILLTSFFFYAEQSASLHKNVDSTDRGLANKHLIVQITACSARDYRDRNEQIDLLPPKSHISKTKDKSQVSAESRKSGVYIVLQNKCQQHYLKKPAPARCVIFVTESFQFAEPDDSMGTLCVWAIQTLYACGF